MTWQFALVILMVVSSSSVIFSKLASDMVHEKSKGIFWLYLFSACLAILWFIFSGKEIGITGSIFLLVIAIGFINGFGNYCHWKALGESMSKTVLFYPLGSIWAIGLAIVFLGEFKFLNKQLIMGVILCFVAIWIFQFSNRKFTKKGKTTKTWLFSILGMSVIFGLAAFLVQVCSFTIPRETFLMGWYFGAFLSMLVLLKLEKKSPFREISKKTLLFCLIAAIGIIGALAAMYWTFQLGGPATSVQPIKGLAMTFIPLVIGWIFFKERVIFKIEWLGFIIGFIGTILILFS